MKKQYIYYGEECLSTNDQLAQAITDNKLSISNIADFILFYSDYQTAGKGMMGNHWESEKGENILASFYCCPPLLPSQLPYFNFFFANLIRNFVSMYVTNRKISIKFPNDIYIENRKVAGILIEPVIEGDKVKHIIAGVGININQEHFPAHLPNPTSLALENQSKFHIKAMMTFLYTSFKKSYPAILKGKFDAINANYQYHLYQKDEVKQYLIDNKTIDAIIKQVTPQGQLLLIEERNGQEYYCNPKEIAFL
ncbi:MAG: biotin--[acetyl-CoA-carboxylase] ligase [Bacteroidales bacterium]|jgi:BirA family biotin operon repressor/biotin-[acetyl-CoA-carboxylase] ligase|nr:biotin--[acetyl-CoA-carboxylase] ligase [Bacteroidales bacterium]